MKLFSLSMLAVLLLTLVGIMGAYVGMGARWAVQPAQIYSPENVRAQWKFAYEYEESLGALARQSCQLDQALKNSQDSSERIQRQTQLLAIQQQYANVEKDYNARLRNAFEAGLVAPPDVPRTAPILNQKQNSVC